MKYLPLGVKQLAIYLNVTIKLILHDFLDEGDQYLVEVKIIIYSTSVCWIRIFLTNFIY